MKEFDYKLPKKANKKKRVIISVSVCVLSVLIAVSYAIFVVIGKDRFINTEVAPFTVSAPETCFNFDSVSGEIVGYYSNEGNVATAPACPMNVKVPSTIDGHTVTKLGGYLFNGLGFTAVEIPNTVTTIGAFALSNNHIRDLVIPDSVTSIGVYSFYNNGIENLTLSNNLVSIPDCAFQFNNINNLVIPSNIKLISAYAFASSKIKTISFNEGLEYIGTSAFSHNDITDLSLPSSLKDDGISAFNHNQLSDDQAFIYKRNADGSTDNTVIVSYGGAKKDGIVVPSQVKEIGQGAFSNSEINSITLNQGLESIKWTAFYINNLTSITIPNTVTSIDSLTFNNNKLQASDAIIYGRNNDGTQNTTIVSYGGVGGEVTIPEGTTAVGAGAFFVSNLTSLSLPSTLVNIEAGAFNANQLPDDQAFIYNRNADGSVDYSKIVSYAGANRNNVIIPTIANGTNLTTIGFKSFDACGLSGAINIPNTVTTIDGNAFSNNNGISSVTIPDSVTVIGSNAFIGNIIADLSLGNSVQYIGEFAFTNNVLSSVTIPNSVTSLGNGAFNPNPITEVKIKGKNSTSDFTSYGTNVFGWKAGYNDSNIEWNAS